MAIAQIEQNREKDFSVGLRRFGTVNTYEGERTKKSLFAAQFILSERLPSEKKADLEFRTRDRKKIKCSPVGKREKRGVNLFSPLHDE